MPQSDYPSGKLSSYSADFETQHPSRVLATQTNDRNLVRFPVRLNLCQNITSSFHKGLSRFTIIDLRGRREKYLAAKIAAKYLTTDQITARVIGRCGYKSLSVANKPKAFAFGKGRHMLKISLVPVTEYQQNCSIVYDDETKSAVVVDPGGDVDKIAAAVDELGVSVEAVWLTHGHLDHAGGAEAAKSKFNVDIIGPHQADKMLLDNIELTARGYGLSGMFNASPDRWLEEDEVLTVGKYDFEVRHCPGHAPGHVVYVNHANKIILMGDVLFRGSIGRTDLPGGNHQELLDSIGTKIMTLGDDYQFVCGHSEPSTIGYERATNPFLQ